MKSNKRIIWMVVALALAVFATGCSFSFSTAKIEDAIMTNSIDESGMPGDTVTSFPANVEIMYTTATVKNAPEDTKVRIDWTYLTDNLLIDSVEVDVGEQANQNISSNLTPLVEFLIGDYQVEYFVDERKEPDATVKFTVTEAQLKTEPVAGAYLEDTHMTSSVDESGKPVDSISIVSTSGTWYVSSILRDTQADTVIHYKWYDTDGNLVDAFDLDPKGASEVYIFGSFVLASVAPEGRYRVEIYIDDATEPAATVDFAASNSVTPGMAMYADFTLYSQAAGGYSFQYPTDWTLQEFPDDMAAWVYPDEYSISGEDDLNTVYVIANKGLADGYTIDTLLQGWVDETNAEGIENYAYIAQSVDNIGGRDIASFSYSWTRGDYALYTVDVLLLDGSDFYVLSFTVTQEAYDTLYPLFEQMALSFQIL